MITWIVTSRYSDENPVVFECVESIRRHHPDDLIWVIDSDSPDTSYLDKLWSDYHAQAVRLKNKHYCIGAYRWALDHIDAPFFALTFDSLIVNQNLHHLTEQDLTVVRYFRIPPNQWVHKPQFADVQNFPFPLTADLVGILGPILFAKRAVLDQLDQLGVFDVKPENRWDVEAMERVMGCALAHLGYDVTQNSLQGEMAGFYDQYDETFVTKRNFARD